MYCQFCGKKVRTSRTVNNLPVCSMCYRKGLTCSDCGAATTKEHGKIITVYMTGCNGKPFAYGRVVCSNCLKNYRVVCSNRLKNYERLENYENGELNQID